MDNHLFRYRQNQDLKYIVIDTETESLNLHYSRPWEISWIVVDKDRIVEEYQCFPFIHDLNVSKGAAETTRFNYDQWKKKTKDPEKILKILESYLYDENYYVVGMNYLKFDAYQVANFQRYLGKKPDFSYITRVYDTLSLGRAMKLGMAFPAEREQVPYWMYQMAMFYQKGLRANLRTLCHDLGLSYDADKHHEGLWDVFKTKEIFKELYFKLEVH